MFCTRAPPLSQFDLIFHGCYLHSQWLLFHDILCNLQDWRQCVGKGKCHDTQCIPSFCGLNSSVLLILSSSRFFLLHGIQCNCCLLKKMLCIKKREKESTEEFLRNLKTHFLSFSSSSRGCSSFISSSLSLPVSHAILVYFAPGFM